MPLAITPTFSPWTHTSDDSYIYQLSLVLATAIVSFRPGWNGWNGTRLLVVVPFKLFASILNFQATEQPTRTKNNPTCLLRRDRAARPEDRGAVTWAASALDTDNDFSCKYSARQDPEQAVLAIQVAPSGKLYQVEVTISPSPLDDDS